MMTWIPERIPGITDVTDISGTYRTLLMLKKDGTLWSIGYNRNGEAGTGSGQENVRKPEKVKGLDRVVQIDASGGRYSAALKADGTVWIWGEFQRNAGRQ